MNGYSVRVPLRIEGSATIAGGQTFSIKLDNIQPVNRGGHSYLRKLHLVLDCTYTSTGGSGNQTLNESHAFDIIHAINLRLPGQTWPVYQLESRAGSHMRALLHAIKGRRPRAHGGGGNITVAEAGTTVRVKLEIPLYCPYSRRPEDWGIPLALLFRRARPGKD